MIRPLTHIASRLFLLLAVTTCLGSSPAALAGDNIDRDIVLVLDNSGSMKINDPGFEAGQAVLRFIQKFEPATAMSIIAFDQNVALAQDFLAVSEDNLSSYEKSLTRINYQGRYTDSPAAIERAIYELKNYARQDSEKMIVFLTDGIVDTGNIQVDVEKTRWLKQELAADAVEHQIKIYAIGFTEKADFQLIQSLAQQTGAEYFRALQVGQLDTAFDKIHQEILALSGTTMDLNEAITSTEEEQETDLVTPPVQQPAEVLDTTEPDVPAMTSMPESEIQTYDSAQDLADPPTIAAEDIRPINRQVTDETNVMLPYVLLAIFLALVAGLVYVLYLRPKWNKKSDEFYISEAYLVDAHGYTNEKRHRLDDSPTMIGRVDTQDSSNLKFISINESTIGRRHALIEYRDFAFWVIDQGSTNGTYVNDRLINQATRLKDGDRVRVHKFEFLFEVPELQEDGVTELSSTVLRQAVKAKAKELPEPQFDISMGHEIPDTAKQSLSSEFDIIEYSEDFHPDSEDETVLPDQLEESARNKTDDHQSNDDVDESSGPQTKP